MSYTIDQNKKLIELFPYLQPRNVWTGKIAENYDYSYIRGDNELPNGWLRLFLLFCKHLKPYLVKSDTLDKFQFSQLKEKYGRLCLYHMGCIEEVELLTCMYQGYSKQVCSRCGRPSKWVITNYIEYLCDDCSSEDINERKKFHRNKHLEFMSFDENEKAVSTYYTYRHIDREYKKIMNMTDDEFFNYLIN